MLYFYVPSVTDISCYVCAIQGSSKAMIYDYVVYLAIIKKFVIVFSLCLTEASAFIPCK